MENLQLGRLDDCIRHYSVLQANLVAFATELDNFPTSNSDAYESLCSFPDEIMRKDILEDLQPHGSRKLPDPPLVPPCVACSLRKVVHSILTTSVTGTTSTVSVSSGVVGSVSPAAASRGALVQVLVSGARRVPARDPGHHLAAQTGQHRLAQRQDEAQLQDVEQQREVQLGPRDRRARDAGHPRTDECDGKPI